MKILKLLSVLVLMIFAEYLTAQTRPDTVCITKDKARLVALQLLDYQDLQVAHDSLIAVNKIRINEIKNLRDAVGAQRKENDILISENMALQTLKSELNAVVYSKRKWRRYRREFIKQILNGRH